MKKKLYLGLLLTASFAAVTFFVANMGSETSLLLKANSEALAGNESDEDLDDGESDKGGGSGSSGGSGGGEIVHIPCIAENYRVCTFQIMDALGHIGNGRVDGAKHI